MGKFVIKKAGEGFMFNLWSANGKVICTSQTYKDLASCKHGAESVKKNRNSKIEDQTVEGFKPVSNPKFEVYFDKAGKYRFRLVAMNGENIAASQGYTRKQACMNGIDSVRRNAEELNIVVEDE